MNDLHLGYNRDELANSPYARFFNPEMAPFPRHITEAMLTGGMAHELLYPVDRAADMHRTAADLGRSTCAVVVLDNVELAQQLRKSDIGRRLIDDQAHGTFIRMGTHVDDRTGKASVGYGRHGDEELALQAALQLGHLARWRLRHRARVTSP